MTTKTISLLVLFSMVVGLCVPFLLPTITVADGEVADTEWLSNGQAGNLPDLQEICYVEGSNNIYVVHYQIDVGGPAYDIFVETLQISSTGTITTVDKWLYRDDYPNQNASLGIMYSGGSNYYVLMNLINSGQTQLQTIQIATNGTITEAIVSSANNSVDNSSDQAAWARNGDTIMIAANDHLAQFQVSCFTVDNTNGLLAFEWHQQIAGSYWRPNWPTLHYVAGTCWFYTYTADFVGYGFVDRVRTFNADKNGFTSANKIYGFGGVGELNNIVSSVYVGYNSADPTFPYTYAMTDVDANDATDLYTFGINPNSGSLNTATYQSKEIFTTQRNRYSGIVKSGFGNTFFIGNTPETSAPYDWYFKQVEIAVDGTIGTPSAAFEVEADWFPGEAWGGFTAYGKNRQWYEVEEGLYVHLYGSANGNTAVDPQNVSVLKTVTFDAPPSLTTSASTDITGTTCTGNGNITSIGGVAPNTRGFCWNTTGAPTIADNTWYETGTFSTGAYTGAVTGMPSGQTIYMRAYATNAQGTGYGNTVSFFTATSPSLTTQFPSDITSTTCTGNGTITDTGGIDPTFRGFCWNLTGSPTTADYGWYESGTFSTGAYSGPVTGLPPLTDIYMRSFATNTEGTGYGNEITFFSHDYPDIYTLGIYDVGASSVSAVGYLYNEGGSSLSEMGFVYGTSGSPTISDSKWIQSPILTPPVEWYDTITGLSGNTHYYVRAYATNAYVTGYGEEFPFNTIPSYNDNTMYLDFEPWNIVPPSSPGTITDVSAYGNNASYTLAEMTDGITVWAPKLLATGGNFYPGQGDAELPNKWIVPPQSGMTQQGDASNLPLYEVFEETADQLNMDPAILYTMMVLAMAMGIGFLIYLIIGSVLVALLVMMVMLAGFMSTGVMPLWILIFFVAFSIGIIYVSRQT